MTDEEPSPRFSRGNARDAGGSPFAWILPVALTGLVILLGWRLYSLSPKDVRDPGAQTRPVAARGDLAADEKATIELFRRASPAVVQVTNLRTRENLLTGDETEFPQGTGSGFVWDPRGYVVTNFHVVNNGTAFTVTFADHSSFDATLVGKDPKDDLAVLKIDPQGKPLPALPVGTSHDLQVGQKVFAIGNPFGLDQTLTTGIISGLDREIVSLAQSPIRRVVQTDAAINPGNSGGPLLDSSGRVIGMNTQIASPSGASAGVGFAIPVDTINRVVPQLIRTGKYLHPGLGVVLTADDVPSRYGLRGVMIFNALSGGGAERAGLRGVTVPPDAPPVPGDTIVSIDGQNVERRADLFRALESREIGQEVEVVFVRDRKEHKAKVKLVGVE